MAQATQSGKPQMMLKWADEKNARPISRELAAKTIRGNRKQPAALRVKVVRKYRDTYIASDFLGVACVIYRKVAQEVAA
jgi:hypothetical protein